MPMLKDIRRIDSKVEDLAKAVDETKNDTRIMISEAVDPLKSEFHSLTERVIKMEEGKGIDNELSRKVQDLEKLVGGESHQASGGRGCDRSHRRPRNGDFSFKCRGLGTRYLEKSIHQFRP